MKKILLTVLLLPQIYNPVIVIADWSTTPTEVQEYYATSSNDIIVSLNDNLVLFGELVK